MDLILYSNGLSCYGLSSLANLKIAASVDVYCACFARASSPHHYHAGIILLDIQDE